MTWFADLTPYMYLPAADDDRSSHPVLNVGWLDPGHAFPTGALDPRLTDHLGRMVEFARTNQTRGWQDCLFCGLSAEVRLIGADGTRYAAPTLVHHYVGRHAYLPPSPFVEALRRVATRVEGSASPRCLACGEPISGEADDGRFGEICAACRIDNDLRRFSSR